MFEEINNKFTQLKTELSEFAETLEFTEICEFSMNDLSQIPWDNLNISGIYKIDIKNNGIYSDFPNWINEFREKWEDLQYKRKFVPNIKTKRIKMHNELQEWIPLYLGKSKKISSRIHQHIFKEMEKTTFALKLYARENIKDETYKLSIIEIQNENYDFIIPFVEKKLRDKINPIIGKQ